MAEGMRDLDKSLRHRTAIAWVVLGLSERGSPIQRKSAEVITQGWAAEKYLYVHESRHLFLFVGAERASLAHDLTAAAGRLEPAEAVRVCAGAARLLSQALAEKQHF